MKLKSLFKEIDELTWKGSKETVITSITANSKAVGPGTLFLAKRGKTGNGHKYIPEAIAAGASAILTDTFDPFLSVTQIIHPDVNALEPRLAHRFYHNPASRLTVYGVTGTSGKTTTTFLIRHFLESVGHPCGLIGGVSWMTGKKILPATLTTPDLVTVLSLFHEMVAEGCGSVAMEISSHAIDQKRVEGIPLRVGVFTNLSQDHLDYHSSMEEYGATKAQMFKDLSPQSIALVNGDDPWSSVMIQDTPAQILRYGLDPKGLLNNKVTHFASAKAPAVGRLEMGVVSEIQPHFQSPNPGALAPRHGLLYCLTDPKFELVATDLELSSRGMQFQVLWKGEKALFKTSLIGRFNIYNILAAAGAVLSQGMSLQKIAEALRHFAGVPGRLERVPNPRQLQVFVDYAHKPDALKNVLQTLREIKEGRLITVFGCGGNRDVQKRPQMAAIAETLSDFTIVTNDNPRGEDPQEIARQVIAGFKTRDRYTVELDRKRAIHQALNLAKPEDLVLIAGKGHETYQLFGDQTFPFDDRQIVQDCI